jgi:hypothetical protein
MELAMERRRDILSEVRESGRAQGERDFAVFGLVERARDRFYATCPHHES